MQQFDKLAMEYAAAHADLLIHSPEKHQSWLATAVGHRFMAYAGKVLVAYRVIAGEVSFIDTWTMTNLKADADHGFLTQWEDSSGKVTYIGHTPVEVADRCFLWHNHNSGYEFTDRYGSPSLRLSMTMRTEGHPATKKEGLTYLTEECKLELLGLR